MAKPIATLLHAAGSCAAAGFAILPLQVQAQVQAGANIPHDLTVSGMFLQADAIVKGVIVILVAASVATFSIWLFKVLEIVKSRRSIAAGLDVLASASRLDPRPDSEDATIAAMLDVALGELRGLPATAQGVEGLKERAGARIQRILAARQRQLSRGVSVLATIAAAAPFIGLFGTVWGILNSFIGISQTQTTNLAVVAPGIAEALLATAFGLVAAIPAVLVYNGLARAITGYRLRMDDAAVQVMCLLSLDLDVARLTKAGDARGI